MAEKSWNPPVYRPRIILVCKTCRRQLQLFKAGQWYYCEVHIPKKHRRLFAMSRQERRAIKCQRLSGS